jgi:DNA-binding XRE family transcriptional regulator
MSVQTARPVAVRLEPPQAAQTETASPVRGLRMDARAHARNALILEYFRAAKEGRISFMKYYRVRKGLDQAQLAEAIGVKQPAVARAERLGGAQRMKGVNLKKYAEALRVSVDDLLR